MDIKNKRIGDLSFSKASYLCTEPEFPAYHINYHYPNDFYGKEKDFIKLDDEFYEYPESHAKNSHFRIHKSMFKHPECSLAIAAFRYDKESKEYTLEYVCDRPLTYIKRYNIQDFHELISYGFKHLNPKWYEEN